MSRKNAARGWALVASAVIVAFCVGPSAVAAGSRIYDDSGPNGQFRIGRDPQAVPQQPPVSSQTGTPSRLLEGSSPTTISSLLSSTPQRSATTVQPPAAPPVTLPPPPAPPATPSAGSNWPLAASGAAMALGGALALAAVNKARDSGQGASRPASGSAPPPGTVPVTRTVTVMETRQVPEPVTETRMATVMVPHTVYRKAQSVVRTVKQAVTRVVTEYVPQQVSRLKTVLQFQRVPVLRQVVRTRQVQVPETTYQAVQVPVYQTVRRFAPNYDMRRGRPYQVGGYWETEQVQVGTRTQMVPHTVMTTRTERVVEQVPGEEVRQVPVTQTVTETVMVPVQRTIAEYQTKTVVEEPPPQPETVWEPEQRAETVTVTRMKTVEVPVTREVTEYVPAPPASAVAVTNSSAVAGATTPSKVTDTDALNQQLMQAKQEWWLAKATGSTQGMNDAHKLADELRARGATIPADMATALDVANQQVLEAKEEWWKAHLSGNTDGETRAHEKAEAARLAGATIPAGTVTYIDKMYGDSGAGTPTPASPVAPADTTTGSGSGTPTTTTAATPGGTTMTTVLGSATITGTTTTPTGTTTPAGTAGSGSTTTAAGGAGGTGSTGALTGAGLSSGDAATKAADAESKLWQDLDGGNIQGAIQQASYVAGLIQSDPNAADAVAKVDQGHGQSLLDRVNAGVLSAKRQWWTALLDANQHDMDQANNEAKNWRALADIRHLSGAIAQDAVTDVDRQGRQSIFEAARRVYAQFKAGAQGALDPDSAAKWLFYRDHKGLWLTGHEDEFLAPLSQELAAKQTAWWTALTNGDPSLDRRRQAMDQAAAEGKFLKDFVKDLLGTDLKGADEAALRSQAVQYANGLEQKLSQASSIKVAENLQDEVNFLAAYGVKPTVAVGAIGDAFWDSIGNAPVTNDGTAFTPQFQAWVDAFNAKVKGHWQRHPDDHIGNTGADNLDAIYQLTPTKVEELWTKAKSSGVDPRLLLAVLNQEGNGSFDTNPSNAKYYKGNGPQPDWKADLDAALDTTIFSKLRLYPYAVKGGFTGTWLDYVNWFTPMDTPAMQGVPGVYAADIHWGDGVASAIRSLAGMLNPSGPDPILAYSSWMGDHPDRYAPKYVKGDFVIKMGLPPGMERPNLAVSKDLPKPGFPGVDSSDPDWWWFPAPDQYCWHVERS